VQHLFYPCPDILRLWFPLCQRRLTLSLSICTSCPIFYSIPLFTSASGNSDFPALGWTWPVQINAAQSFSNKITLLMLNLELHLFNVPRSACEWHLVVPSQRGTKSLSWTFTLTVPSWWNDQPNSTQAAESLAIFKNIFFINT